MFKWYARRRSKKIIEKIQAFDRETMRKGEIPWSKDECMDALKHEMQLIDTHPDDWDRKRRVVAIQDGVPIVVNPDYRMNQVAWYILGRYDENMEIAYSHLWRYMAIQRLLKENYDELVSDGLIREPQDIEEPVEVSEALIEILATSPYEKPAEDEEGYWVFDYDKIADRALRLMAAADEE